MPIPSLIAIYFLFFFMSLFLVLPFGVRTADEAGIEKVPGQAESAPAHFSFWRTALHTGILALVFTTLFYQNYQHGWITRASFDGVAAALGAPQD
jgi:predicted secreted protein